MRTEKTGMKFGALLAAAGLVAGMVSFAGCKETDKSKTAAGPAQPAAVAAQRQAPLVMGAVNPSAVVVTVGDKKLTEGELGQRMDRMLSAQGMDGMPPEQLGAMRDKLRKNVVEAFVAQTVLEKEADAQKIAVTPEQVTERLEKIKKQIPEGADFAAILKDAGTTEDKVRDEIKRDMQIVALIEKQAPVEAVTDKEAQEFYTASKEQFDVPETVHARHILVLCDKNADDAAMAAKKKTADDARQKLVDGADFAALAKQVSECPSKQQGGDLGTFPKGRMVKEFEEAAFAQKTNDIGPVVKTEFGYHIIQVLAHNQAGTKAFDEVKDDVKTYLTQNRKQQAAVKYVGELVKKADVKYEGGM